MRGVVYRKLIDGVFCVTDTGYVFFTVEERCFWCWNEQAKKIAEY